MDDSRPIDRSDDAFIEQVVRYLDGTTTAGESARIERDLLDSPRRRELFLDICLQAALIAESSSEVLSAPAEPIEQGARSTEQSAASGDKRVRSHPEGTRKGAGRERMVSRPRSRSPVLGFLDRMMHAGGDFRLNPFLVVAGLAGLFLILSLATILPAYLSLRQTQWENAQRVLQDERERQLAASKAQEEKAAAGKAKKASRASFNAYAKLLSERNPSRAIRAVGDSVGWVYAHGFAQARLAFAVDCRWRGVAPDVGEALTRGRRLELKSGLAEVVFQNGARTILQGPATLEIRSGKSAYLQIGRYSVNVEDPRAKGFEVGTPGMKYTDLGTEFAVSVDADGEQEMHVFRGTVQAEQEEVRDQRSDVRNQKAANVRPLTSDLRPLVLSAHQAIRVAAPAEPGKPATPIEPIAADQSKFVRTMSVALDLVDIVAGGDGLSTRRNRSINPTNGRYQDEPHGQDNMVTSSGGIVFKADRQFQRVPQNALIDGVFVLNGSGPVQLDSGGHRFAGFPGADRETSNFISALGAAASQAVVFASGEQGHLSKFGSADYSSVGHGILYIRNNKGITFDLEAIRRIHPRFRLVSLTAMALNPCPNSDDKRHVDDYWVIIDGQVRFQRQRVTSRTGEVPIDVRLGQTDRFLSLVTSGTLWSNWSMLGDPKLNLELKTISNNRISN